jgi:hypothetical protein
METGYPKAAASLVALADGSASIYFSSGGGIIGGQPHEAINTASRRLVELANQHLPKMSPATQYPLPTDGRVKFYMLTTQGIFSADAVEEHLGAGNHSLSALFFAGHEVITALRESSEARER